jgi:hypothetical protein
VLREGKLSITLYVYSVFFGPLFHHSDYLPTCSLVVFLNTCITSISNLLQRSEEIQI